jgi:pimeloyl-ACP methyl ester carboxylesterase
MTALSLNKIKTHHAVVDVLSGGSGPDLFFLHGAGGITAEDPFLTALAQKYRVHAPLLPGYGASDECESIRTMLDFTLHSYDVLDTLGLRKPIVVGHSKGGMMAAEMAAIAPHDIDRLCLLCPAGLWLDEYPMPDIFSMVPYELPAVLFHDVEAGAAMMTAGADFSDLTFLQNFLVQNARQLGMAGKILFPIADRGLSERLYRIRAKTLLVWGASDRLTPLPYGEAFKKGIAGSELVVIEKAGHMLPLEQTDSVIQAMGKLK